MENSSGSVSAALASFIDQAGFFEGPIGLLVCNGFMSTVVSWLLYIGTWNTFLEQF